MERDLVEANAKRARALFVIQDWHVVLGDPHASYRTTSATELLREIKHEFKQQFRGKGASQWIENAIRLFNERLHTQFPAVKDPDDLGRVLIKCNKKTTASGRVLEPNVCHYPGDATPTYGIAQKEKSLAFFFHSRDAPTLGQELQKYKKLVNRFLQQHPHSPRESIRSFVKILLFFQEQLDASLQGDVLAKTLLQSLSVIPTLRTQWNLVETVVTARTSTIESGVEVKPNALIPWKRLELKLTRRQLATKARHQTNVPPVSMLLSSPLEQPSFFASGACDPFVSHAGRTTRHRPLDSVCETTGATETQR